MSARWWGLLALAAASPAAAQRLAYEGSLGMTTGRYIFTTRTTTFSFSTGLAVTTGRLTLRASLPVWMQNSTVLTAGGTGGMVPSGGSSGGTVSDSGKGQGSGGGGGGGGGGSGGGGMGGGGQAGALALSRVDVPASAFTDYRAAIGDPLVGASMTVVDGRRVRLGFGAAVKVPLADTAHYGTGAWDVGGSASLSLQLDPRTIAALDGSWWHLGDLPELDFRDPFSGSLSLSRLLGRRWAAAGFLRASTSAVPGFAAPATVGGSLTHLGGTAAVGMEVALGLTETSPDVGLTAYWRVPLR